MKLDIYFLCELAHFLKYRGYSSFPYSFVSSVYMNSKSPAIEPSNCQLSKMWMCVPSTSRCQLVFCLLLLTILQLYHFPPPLHPPVTFLACSLDASPCMPAAVLNYCTSQDTVFVCLAAKLYLTSHSGIWLILELVAISFSVKVLYYKIKYIFFIFYILFLCIICMKVIINLL